MYANIREPAVRSSSIDARGPRSSGNARRAEPGPHGLWLDGGRLFCAADGGATPGRRGSECGEVRASLPLPGAPDVVMHDPELRRLYVAVGDPGLVCCFDTDRLEHARDGRDRARRAHDGWDQFGRALRLLSGEWRRRNLRGAAAERRRAADRRAQAARALAYGLGSVLIGVTLARRGLSARQVGAVLAALLAGTAARLGPCRSLRRPLRAAAVLPAASSSRWASPAPFRADRLAAGARPRGADRHGLDRGRRVRPVHLARAGDAPRTPRGRRPDAPLRHLQHHRDPRRLARRADRARRLVARTGCSRTRLPPRRARCLRRGSRPRSSRRASSRRRAATAASPLALDRACGSRRSSRSTASAAASSRRPSSRTCSRASTALRRTRSRSSSSRSASSRRSRSRPPFGSPADRAAPHDGLQPPAVERPARGDRLRPEPAARDRTAPRPLPLSQMDVPTRQAYVVAVVDPSERTAAAAYTNTARYVTRPLGPLLAGVALRGPSARRS